MHLKEEWSIALFAPNCKNNVKRRGRDSVL